jgi:hypothetical protein
VILIRDILVAEKTTHASDHRFCSRSAADPTRATPRRCFILAVTLKADKKAGAKFVGKNGDVRSKGIKE